MSALGNSQEPAAVFVFELTYLSKKAESEIKPQSHSRSAMIGPPQLDTEGDLRGRIIGKEEMGRASFEGNSKGRDGLDREQI